MPPVADDIERLEVCSQCDSVVGLSALQKGETACCGRCGHELERFHGEMQAMTLAKTCQCSKQYGHIPEFQW